MYTLYIDTHFVDLVLSLFKDEKIVETIKIENANHSDIAISLLDKLLKSHNLTIDDLNSIIVINGPGSFTGVRIGIVIAKIIGYTKNIPVKAISYLQALSLNYQQEVYVGLKDRNGIYIGHFNSKHELLEDYCYLSNKEYEAFNHQVVLESDVNLNALYEFAKTIPESSIHSLKPLYIKKIEVLND